MRRFVLAAALLCAVACFDHTDIFQGNSQGTATSPTGGDFSCSQALAVVNIDVENGTSGGAGQVGVPLEFSGDPRDAAGSTLPQACLTSPVSFRGSGVCPDPQGVLSSFTTVPTAPGTCTVSVAFLGKTFTKAVTVH